MISSNIIEKTKSSFKNYICKLNFNINMRSYMIHAGLKLASMAKQVWNVSFFSAVLANFIVRLKYSFTQVQLQKLLLESPLGIAVQVKTADYGPNVYMSLVYLQYSSQCFCGDQLLNVRKMRESDCLQPCAGDRTQGCGGAWRIAVYENPQYIPSE